MVSSITVNNSVGTGVVEGNLPDVGELEVERDRDELDIIEFVRV